ncbi:zinc transporter ZntB [Parasulfitobacter algicola]|uniref:Zinc transporter ZntB n=1 Tax=Parasulfitobacter algicola TaxID=2614809 RepID=A0ABX2IV47_9RHOB|nr:zinc transporter ZntB [Sulfitobacter algicola]NSX54925.1 zinc transporter ZntB [Sulfitobacter algicola]
MPNTTLDHPDLIEDEGLLFACTLDGEGGARFLGWDDIDKWTNTDGPLWMHMDHKHPRVVDWVKKQSGLTTTTTDALLAEETRPRVFRGRRGLVTILRGVNLNESADGEDMVAIRLWSEGERVITLRHERLHTPRNILVQLIELNTGPKTAPELFERLISRINDNIADTILTLEEQLGDLEGDLDISKAAIQRRDLSHIRQKAVALRRYIAPQREALGTLVSEPPSWMDDHSRAQLRETSDRLMRYLEELDAVRERAMVVKDDIANQLSEASNKTLYVLAIISAIFLPLAFLTGLLGINIGGMPGVENPYAFWIFCAVMIVCLIIEVYIFRKLKWL